MGNYVKLEMNKVCGFCKRDLSNDNCIIDGATYPIRQWALMCENCFNERGIGIGEGVGQAYYKQKDGSHICEVEDDIGFSDMEFSSYEKSLIKEIFGGC